MKPRFNTLNEWLAWQESSHWTAIDLGLRRITEVAKQLQLLSLPFPVITVAGTNGKGSTVALLESMLVAEGYHTGSSTSPYLYRYNERIKLSTKEADDQLICAAFEAIDEARAHCGVDGEAISLTYFEFATLAAMWVFKQQKVQVAIMEVGMGGRLDAVNLWDADVAVITSIGIDHVQWLGDNREAIGHEKAGIMRQNHPVISGDLDPPRSILKHASAINAILYQAGNHFSWQVGEAGWDVTVADQHYTNLPFPALKGGFQFNNAAVAIAALYAINSKLNVGVSSIHKGLKRVVLSGRLEQVQHQPDVILDVAHNAHAGKQLSNWLAENPTQGKTYALFSMLEDKDITQVIELMNEGIDHWFVSTVDDPRGIEVATLVKKMKAVDADIKIEAFDTIKTAWGSCKLQLSMQDRVIVFGSFLVLSEFKVIF